MPTVLLIRHAQASFGAADYDVLSELGRRQAEVVAAALARRGVVADRLVAGGNRRQGETAEPFLGGGPELEIDERWNEFSANEMLEHHGPEGTRLDGSGGTTLTTQEFQKLLDVAMREWIAQGDDSPCSQSYAAFAALGLTALDSLFAELDRGQTAFVFTSAGVIAGICATLLDSPSDAFVALNRVQVNTGISKVVRGSADPSLIGFNDHAHLEDTDRALVTYR